MRPSPFTQRLFALQVSHRPEDATELAFLEDHIAWKAAGGLTAYEHQRAREKAKQGQNYDRIMRWKAKHK